MEAVSAPVGAETLDVLGSLVDKSLVVADRSGDEYRYRVLETIREYGHGLLIRTGELDAACRRMVVWVLGLADGCSNREIGERLFMSVKTVERHLGNLYRKLDVTNRTQAAAYAIRHGLGSA